MQERAQQGARHAVLRLDAQPVHGLRPSLHVLLRPRLRAAGRPPSGEAYGASIRVKVNVADVLRTELARRTWQGESVALGTATDPYQPAEGRYRLTRACLRVLADAENPFSIVTRGPLIVRDVDVLADAAARTQVGVSFSVPTLDEEVWRRTEPGTAPPRQRLRALEQLAKRGHRRWGGGRSRAARDLRPPEQLREVVEAARAAGATHVWASTLHLRPGTREHFLAHLAEDWPELMPFYDRLFGRNAYAPKETQATIAARVAELRSGTPGRRLPVTRPRARREQLTLI